jgi:hypothetical protein
MLLTQCLARFQSDQLKAQTLHDGVISALYSSNACNWNSLHATPTYSHGPAADMSWHQAVGWILILQRCRAMQASCVPPALLLCGCALHHAHERVRADGHGAHTLHLQAGSTEAQHTSKPCSD